MNPQNSKSAPLDSEAHYRSLLENISLGVFRMTPEGKTVAVNPVAVDLLGYGSTQEMMTHAATAFFVDPEKWRSFLKHLEREKQKSQIDLRVKRRDGSIIWCIITAWPVLDESGKLQFIDGTVEEVSARKQEEEKLLQQNLYMRSLQDVMLAVVSRLEPLDVLETVLNRAVELMETIHGFLFNYDEKTNRLVLKAGSGIYRESIGFSLKKGEGLAGKVWESKAPIVVNDYQTWAGRHPDPIWDSVCSAAGVPIKSKDKFLGVIGIIHTEKGRRVGPQECELLNRFVELASIVLDNAQLYSKLEEELQKRRRIEKELTKSEERYRSVVEDLAEFVLRWKPDGSVIFANDVYCRYKQKSKTQVIGKNVKSLFSKPAFEQAEKIISRLNPDRPLEANDILTLGPDNKPIWEEWTDRGIFDENGKLIEIQSVGRNITERKLAEKALQENEYRFRSFFNSSPEGIILVDLDGNILDANTSLLQFTGYRLEELKGRSYQTLTHSKYHSQIVQNIDALMKGLVSDETLEIEYLNKNGSSIPVLVRGWGITDEKGNPVALGGFIRDITREKSLAADKAALEKQLQQTQKMEAIGTLAGGIAHDFNNILSGILGYAELALAEPTDSSAGLKHYLSGILNACHRAKSLVQHILKFSRKEGDTALAPLSVAPILEEAIKLLRSTLPTTIRIRENISVDLDTVVASATQLHQVIMNLGTNAYHAMRETGGALTVSLQNKRLTEPKYFLTLSIPPGEYVKLSVTDTGPGIPPNLFDRIFEPYFTTKEKQEGTGLGLSVTFGIIKNLNGLIEVEHSSSETTTFAVYLPLEKKVGTDAKRPLHLLPTGNNENVLCVDDESVFLEVVQKHLERLGYRVTSYRSSIRALERFKANPASFDLIITDQTMPEMTGVQLVREIRKINTSIPIVLCTGYSEAVTANTSKQFGISGFLAKPVTLNKLAHMVYSVLRNPAP